MRNRIALNHAGTDATEHVPFNDEDEKEVQSALGIMYEVAQMYIEYERSNNMT